MKVLAAQDEAQMRLREAGVRSLVLQFTDILGSRKAVAVPVSQLRRALAGEVVFDGSAMEGFVRVEEQDMHLLPDADTLLIDSWQPAVARVLCNIIRPDGSPFDGCPRTQLRRQLQRLEAHGLQFYVASEPEFFLFEDVQALSTRDTAGYFDFVAADRGETLRAQAADALEEMGIAVLAHHHEVSPGQHEIDLAAAPALEAADRLTVLNTVVHALAARQELLATFMPKPHFGQNGSGLHLHLQLRGADGDVMGGGSGEHRLSNTGQHALAGLLEHAAAMTAIANPLVNSYKRLTPGYEAPVAIDWSLRQRSPMVRVVTGTPAALEWRSPDASCNPYLALTVAAAAMLDGIERGLPLVPPGEETAATSLPADLKTAVEALSLDQVILKALGPLIARQFRDAKEIEWEIYQLQVHDWEVKQYLRTF